MFFYRTADDLLVHDLRHFRNIFHRPVFTQDLYLMFRRGIRIVTNGIGKDKAGGLLFGKTGIPAHSPAYLHSLNCRKNCFLCHL